MTSSEETMTDRSREISNYALQLVGTALTEPQDCAKAADQIIELLGTEYYDGEGDGILARIVEFLREVAGGERGC
jgi:hypothetical protein